VLCPARTSRGFCMFVEAGATGRPIEDSCRLLLLARRGANGVRRLAPAFVSPRAFRAVTLRLPDTAATGSHGESVASATKGKRRGLSPREPGAG
jgi:hypothetical protein